MTAPRIAPPGADKYDGWKRLAERAAQLLPLAELDHVWTFPKLRHERRELGTAVFSRVKGDRRQIFTGRWALVIRGPERGQFQAAFEEVGSGPLEALEAMLQEVRRRVDDAEPPVPVRLADFFGAEVLAAARAAAGLTDEAVVDTAGTEAAVEVDEAGASAADAPAAAEPVSEMTDEAADVTEVVLEATDAADVPAVDTDRAAETAEDADGTPQS